MFVMNLHVFMRVCTRIYVCLFLYSRLCVSSSPPLSFPPSFFTYLCPWSVSWGLCVCVVGILALQAL